MQLFVNRTDLERIAAAIYAGPRARYALYALTFCVVTLAAGITLALTWLSLAVLTDAARAALLSRLPGGAPGRTQLALDIVAASALAAAPTILWFADAHASAPAAMALLSVFLIEAGLNAKTSRVYTLLICTPYAGLGLIMALGGGASFWGVVACGCAVVYGFGAALHHTGRATADRQQNAELVRQSNMRQDTAHSATWEIDYERRTISGGEAFSALLGRPATYHAVAEGACFATEADRALVRAAFSAHRRAAQRIALEHEAVREDGSSVRVRHEGFLRTAPDGAPQRLYCTSTIAGAASANAADGASAVFALQAEALRKLGRELGTAPMTAAATSEIADLVQTLASQAFLISDGVSALADRHNAADSANRAKSQFIASMSHELRTPLNAVLGYAEILKEDAEDRNDAGTIEDLDRILDAAKHLLALLNEIRDLSKLDAARPQPAPALAVAAS